MGKSNDDKILDCCLYAVEHITPNVVMLCNDKNLCIKSELHGIITFSNYDKSPAQFLEELSSERVSSWFFSHPKFKQSPAGLQSIDYSSHVDHEMEVVSDTEIMDLQARELPEILAELHEILIGCCTASITRILDQKLSSDWVSTFNPQPPWNLGQIFKILNREHILRNAHPGLSRMSFVSLTSIANDITRSVRQKKAILTIGDIKNFLNNIEPIFYICDEAGFAQDRIRATQLIIQLKTELQFV